jgi:hypothetical protein
MGVVGTIFMEVLNHLYKPHYQSEWQKYVGYSDYPNAEILNAGIS